MKRMDRFLALLLALSLAAGVLAGCGRNSDKEETLSVVMTGLFDTADPALAATAAERTAVLHLFDNLLRWDGEKAVSAVAQSWQQTDNEDGTQTYTFHLRGDAVWSDGSKVTAEDFVYAWKRLVSPDTASPNADILCLVAGYEDACAGDWDALQVSAPDAHTFEVTLSGPCAYFVERICTAPATMPVQQAAAERSEDWAAGQRTFVGNGPYRRTGDWADSRTLTLEKQEEHYDARRVAAGKIEISLQTEEQAAAAVGTADVVIGAPAEAAGNGGDPTVGLLLINQMATSMEKDGLRHALSLAIDRGALAESLGARFTAADGLIPSGIRTGGGEDFREVNGALIDNDPETYGERCTAAVAELRQAGFASALSLEQLGTVTLLYDSGSRQAALARMLQQTWREVLGLQVTLQGVSGDEYRQTLRNGEYTLALTEMSASCNDAAAYLDPWRSGDMRNYALLYMNAYDILMRVAAASSSDEARDAYLKDAEVLLLDSGNVIPLYGCRQPYATLETVAGAVSDGLGAWYFGAARHLPQ